MFQFKKEVNVTNTKNVLCQVPCAVVRDWGLEVGDKLELIYTGSEVTIRPALQRGSGATEENDRVVRAAAT